MTFTIVTCYRESDPWRRRNLEKFLEWNKDRFPQAEILIIEQSHQCALPENHRGARVLSQKWDGLFNRSWALNAGVRHASHQHLIVSDCDLLIEKHLIEQALIKLEEGILFAQLGGYTYDLTAEASGSFTSLSVYSESLPSGGRRKLTIAPGGAYACTKQAVSMVGWMDEGFQGWGGEDQEFFYRIVLLIGWKQLAQCQDRGITHLWHPQTASANPMHAANIQRIASRRRWTRDAMRTFLARNNPSLLGTLKEPLLSFGDPQ